MEDEISPLTYQDPSVPRSKFNRWLPEIYDDYVINLDKIFTDCLLKRGVLYTTAGLANIQYTAESLKAQGESLAVEINRQPWKEENICHRVDIKILNSHDNLRPLKICVYRLTNDDDLNMRDVIYVGVFFSWRSNSFPSNTYLNLPFLFSCGSQKYIQLLNTLYEKYFDTRVSPVTFSQLDIKWLLTIFTNCIPDSHCDEVQLVCMTKDSDLKVEIKFSFTNLKNVWNTIYEDASKNQIRCEEMVTLNAALVEHILESYGIDLDHFLIKNLSLHNQVVLNSSGKVCIGNRDLLDVFFRFLSIGKL